MMSVTDDNCDESCPDCGVVLSGESSVCICNIEWELEGEGLFYVTKME